MVPQGLWLHAHPAPAAGTTGNGLRSEIDQKRPALTSVSTCERRITRNASVDHVLRDRSTSFAESWFVGEQNNWGEKPGTQP
jgi:hypothetical protein